MKVDAVRPWQVGDKFVLRLGRSAVPFVVVMVDRDWLYFYDHNGFPNSVSMSGVLRVDVDEASRPAAVVSASLDTRMFIRLDVGHCICGIAKVMCRYHGDA